MFRLERETRVELASRLHCEAGLCLGSVAPAAQHLAAIVEVEGSRDLLASRSVSNHDIATDALASTSVCGSR